jgi:hypothetical protein
MTTRRTATQTTVYTASSTGARASFMGLAAAVTFAVLASLGNVADRQVEDVLMAQAGALPVAQTGSAAAPHNG